MSFRLEPFLWIHLAGLVVLPLFLELTLLGLAIADSVLPFGLEFSLLAILGIAPIFWMQWSRPFDIFSLLAIAIAPTQLAPEQRRILRLFKTTQQRILTALAAIAMLWGLWQLYRFAPLAATAATLLPQSRPLGLAIAIFAFAASNLFLQVPVSVLGVLLTSQQKFEAIEPLEGEKIPLEFTVLGLQVKQILPPVVR
jgi:hypothetical protein